MSKLLQFKKQCFPDSIPLKTPAQKEHEDLGTLVTQLAEKNHALARLKNGRTILLVELFPDGEITVMRKVELAQQRELADRGWIERRYVGQVEIFRLSSKGRAALYDGALTDFAKQHQLAGTRYFQEGDRMIPKRVNLAESPLNLLAGRKDRDGKPFLSKEMLLAGELLREDFERAHLGPRVAQNWDQFLVARQKHGFSNNTPGATGSSEARQRIQEIIADLGPGLSDIVLRCCCFLEGLEATEKTLGWSARSGKIVLRIALERLVRYYKIDQGAPSRPVT